MSFVNCQPELLSSAAANLGSIGAAMNAGNAAAAAPIASIVPAAGDAVSALTAAQFAAHGAMYQAISGQAAAFHEFFVSALAASGNCYTATEAANAAAVR